MQNGDGRYGHATVVFDNKIWLIGGNDGSQCDVWFSSDGIIWTESAKLSEITGIMHHTLVIFDNKIWILGG